MKKPEEIVNKCVDNILLDFEDKMKKIMTIQYHYNLFDTFDQLNSVDESMQFTIYEVLINNYLNKLKDLNYNEVMKNIYEIEEILDFFDFYHFSNSNDDIKGYVRIEEEAEQITDELLSKVLKSKGSKINLPISIKNIKEFYISNIQRQEDINKIFMWIILKLSVTYHYSSDKV